MTKVSSSNSNTPKPRLVSLASALDDVLDPAAEGQEEYIVFKKQKGDIGVDGCKVKILDRRRIEDDFYGDMKNNYKEAEKFIRKLVADFLRDRTKKDLEATKAVGELVELLAKSKKQSYVKLGDNQRKALKIVTDAIKMGAQEAVAPVVVNDLSARDGGVVHFIEHAVVRNSLPNGEPRKPLENEALECAKKGGSQKLLGDIWKINDRAKNLCSELAKKPNSPVARRLKLRRRSFTAPENTGNASFKKYSLLDKIADWPGTDLRDKTARFLEISTQPDCDIKKFKEASKELLQALREQECYLELVQRQLTTDPETIEKDPEQWHDLGMMAGQLLAKIRGNNSPFTRLRDLAIVAYSTPKETAREIAVQTGHFLPATNYPSPPLVVPVANPPPVWIGGPPPTTLPPPLFLNNAPPPSDNPPAPLDNPPPLQPVIQGEEQPLDNVVPGNHPKPSNSGNPALASNNQLPPAHKAKGDAAPLRPLPLIPDSKPLVPAQQPSSPGAPNAAVHNVLPPNDAQSPRSVKERVAQFEAANLAGLLPQFPGESGSLWGSR